MREQVRRTPERNETSMTRAASQGTVQRQSAPSPGVQPTVRRGTIQRKGALPPLVRAKMEQSFATDFSDVNVHVGPEAAEVGALAYTQGSDIHFAQGQYNPDSPSGQSLLGHELAHVVQQRQGRVRPTTSIGGLAVNDQPALEQEADRLGARAAQTKLDPSRYAESFKRN